jgi:hypothetical protein
VEVLILRPYSSEARLHKFVDNSEVFSGLVMFYNTGDANDGYKRQFLSVAPKNQPLLLALVFHDYSESDNSSKSLIKNIGGICGALYDNPEVIQLAFSIIKLDPLSGADAVNKLINKLGGKKYPSEEEALREVIPSLRKVRKDISEKGKSDSDNCTSKYDFDFTNEEVFKQQYKQYFGNMPVRNYDNVKDYFKKDLEILLKFLIHACIPAIKLEKPFVSREVQSINNLLDLVASTEFDDMIDNNSEIILPEDYSDINVEMENLIANKAAVAEVEKILKTIEGAAES